MLRVLPSKVIEAYEERRIILRSSFNHTSKLFPPFFLTSDSFFSNIPLIPRYKKAAKGLHSFIFPQPFSSTPPRTRVLSRQKPQRQISARNAVRQCQPPPARGGGRDRGVLGQGEGRTQPRLGGGRGDEVRPGVLAEARQILLAGGQAQVTNCGPRPFSRIANQIFRPREILQ